MINIPTGYTSFIEDGRITTGKDFLKLCTRAFGVAASLKDEPLSVPTPTNFEPDPYCKEEYENAVVELEKAKKMTFEEAKIQMKSKFEKRTADAKRFVDNALAVNKKYIKIRKEIEKWIPPSDDYMSIKRFALYQIDTSIFPQEQIDFYQKKIKEKYVDSDENVQAYIAENIAYYQDEVEYYHKCWKEELKQVKRNNEWMQTFLNSLKDEKEKI